MKHKFKYLFSCGIYNYNFRLLRKNMQNFKKNNCGHSNSLYKLYHFKLVPVFQVINIKNGTNMKHTKWCDI